MRGAARRKAEDAPFAPDGLLDPPGRRRLRRMPGMLDLLSNRQKSIKTDIGEAASEFAPQTGLPETHVSNTAVFIIHYC
ncbi:MAG: hypothetical protein LBU32_09845 [Clostridiales bacterium]|nr:hypothetical protein [Clostridiales bacterium]